MVFTNKKMGPVQIKYLSLESNIVHSQVIRKRTNDAASILLQIKLRYRTIIIFILYRVV